jgi:hypothetical protein
MRANLAYRQQPAGEDAAVEPIAIPDEVARLYDELRDCVRANDQQGVKRIFGELVLARRPVSEISAVVESLSKAGAKEEPRTSSSSAENFIQHRAASAFVENVPEPAEGPADPAPVPEGDPAGAVIATAEPENDPADQNPALDEISEFEERAPDGHDGSPIAAISEFEEDRGPLDGAFGSDVPYEMEPPISDPATALASVRESLQYAASAADHSKASRALGASPAAGRRQGLSKAGTGAGIVAVLAMISGGAFWLTHSSPRDVGAGTTLPVSATSTFDAVAPSTAAAQGSPETAATAPRPEQAGAPTAIVMAVPERDPAERPEAKPPERADKANPVSLSASDGPAAAAPAIPPALPSSASADRPVPKPMVPSAEAPEKKTAAVALAVPEVAAPAAATPVGVPAAPVAAPTDRPQAKPPVASLEAPKNAAAIAVPGSAASSAPPAATPAATAPEAVAPKQPSSTPVETAPLLERGDQLFGVGDIASARLFYERAADAGDGQAALRLGETYDPVFLERAKLRAIKGDRAAAVFWYRRARELGVAEAEILLMGIPTK